MKGGDIMQDRKNKSKIRRENAIRHIINDLLNGAVYSVLKAKLIEDAYNIGHRYSEDGAYDLVAEARRRILKDFEEEREHVKAELMARLNDLFTECREVGDRGVALKTLQEIAKLTGAYEAQKVEAKVDNTININFGLDN